MSFVYEIENLPDAPRDGKCWRLIISKPSEATFPCSLKVFEGRYTARIGAERAAKRQMKILKGDQ